MLPPTLAAALKATPHHLGYVAADLRAAASHWSKILGIGPFLLYEHIPFDSVFYGDEIAEFDHSAAFARWGDIYVEIQEIHHAGPAALRERLTPFPGPSLNHVAVPVSDPEELSAQLSEAGSPLHLRARVGDIEVFWHDTVDELGFSVEVHRAGPALTGFFDDVDAAAREWDGDTPFEIRSLDK